MLARARLQFLVPRVFGSLGPQRGLSDALFVHRDGHHDVDSFEFDAQSIKVSI